MTRGEGPGVPDGIKIDSAGNVYCAAQGGVHTLGPDGMSLGPEPCVSYCLAETIMKAT